METFVTEADDDLDLAAEFSEGTPERRDFGVLEFTPLNLTHLECLLPIEPRRQSGSCCIGTRWTDRSETTVDRHFRYAVDNRYLPVLVAFGFRRTRDGVLLADDGVFRATFGRFKLTTPIENVTGAHVTRSYRWWTSVGVRRSAVDDGLTFGTNHDAGVCVHFAEAVPSALRRKGHSALTVTVADLDGLVLALGGQGEESVPRE